MATKIKLTGKQKAFRALFDAYGNNDRDISFLANVIICHCSRAALKLKNLKKLLDHGCEIRCHQFNMFKFRVDGRIFDISILDKTFRINNYLSW